MSVSRRVIQTGARRQVDWVMMPLAMTPWRTTPGHLSWRDVGTKSEARPPATEPMRMALPASFSWRVFALFLQLGGEALIFAQDG